MSDAGQKAAAAREIAAAAAVLRAIARPRLAGSRGAQEVTAEIHRRLEESGYEVAAVPFHFSTWPGRYLVSVAGMLLLVGSAGSGWLLLEAPPGVSLALLLPLTALLALAGGWAGVAVDRLPWGRIRTSNLLAWPRPTELGSDAVAPPGSVGAGPGSVSPDESATPPAVRWLVMAHRDSKSQPLPLAVRLPAITAAILGWLTLWALAMASFIVPPPPAVVLVVALVAGSAGGALIFLRAGNRSPGALDNATGVAALLGIAEREVSRGDVAFLVTDGEELGLAGARAMVQRLPPVAGVINLDGLDDEGDFHLLERAGWPPRGVAPELVGALIAAAAARGAVLRRRDVPLGLLLDHIPLQRAGIPAVTLLRGSTASLRRVHRPSDTPARLRGIGVHETVLLACAALALLRRKNMADG